MHAVWMALLLAAGLQAAQPAQPTPASGKPALDIALEQEIDGKDVPVSPTHVFHSGDKIRVRVTSEFDGYLYIMDQGTSGSFATLFPTLAAGSDNRVQRGQSYAIPSTSATFQISGPAGFDVLYILLSPEPIATPTASSFVAPGPVSSLKPRCNDSVFRARGECTDVTAGPAPVPRDAALPAPIAPLAGAASRDIIVTKKKDAVTVSSEGSKTAPVIYTFRLAHN